MREKAWRVAAAALLMGFAIGVPGGGQAAADQDSALFEDGPVRRDPPLRVEWVASADRSGRPRLEGSVRNEYGRTARNVQLRISEINAAGETVSSVIGPTLESVPGQGEAHFEVPVPANRYRYRVAVASFSFDFAEPAAR